MIISRYMWTTILTVSKCGSYGTCSRSLQICAQSSEAISRHELLFVCVCVHRITVSTNCDDFLAVYIGCMTSSSWLDIGGDPDRGADTGILNGIFTIVGYGQFCAQLHKQWLQCLWVLSCLWPDVFSLRVFLVVFLNVLKELYNCFNWCRQRS